MKEENAVKEDAVKENVTPPEKKKKKGRWKKVLIYTVLTLVVLIIAAIITLDFTIAAAVRTVGSSAVGTKVSLDSFRLWILGGRAVINKLAVANPPGYNQPAALELNKMVFDLDTGTVFSDKIVVEELTVDGLTMNYDLRLDGSSNLKDIQNNLEKFAGSAGEKPAETKPAASQPAETKPAADNTTVSPEEQADAAKTASKKVVIKKFTLQNSYFVISSTSLGINTRIPLPTLELENVGEGKNLAETLNEIYQEILKVALKTAADTDSSLSEIGSSLEKGLKDAGKELEKGSKGALDALKNIFK